jgi:hypothetical protein
MSPVKRIAIPARIRAIPASAEPGVLAINV